MILAYPVNKEGKRNGEDKWFSDREWERLMKQRVIRWIQLPDPRIVNKQVANEEKPQRTGRNQRGSKK